LSLGICFGCNTSNPPVAEKIPSEKVIHGVTVSDPYKWMENPKDPKTIAYIRDENAYADNYFRRISGLKENLQKELEERFDYQTRLGSIPILEGDYYYYKRIPKGKEFPVHYRKLNEENAKEEQILDENELSKGSLNFHMDQFLVSPDYSSYLYCYTLNGDNCRLIVRSFEGKATADSIVAPVTSAAWAQKGRSIVYVKNDKEILLHKINSPAGTDVLIYSEKRHELFVDVELSGSGKYIFISSYNNESTECSYIPADLKSLKPVLIDPLKKGRRYFADHFSSGFFLILSGSSSGSQSFYKAFISSPSAKNWTTVLEGSDSLVINSYTVVDGKYLLLFETKNMNARMRIIDLTVSGKDNQITFREPDGQIEFLYYDRKESKIAFSFTSLLTPVTVYTYDIAGHRLGIRRQPAIKDYRKEDYIAEMLWARSGDGTLIPVSVIHKNGAKRSDGLNPLYLEGYGSYGYTDRMVFTADIISLLDRGVYMATAHIRGGGELGNKWGEAGKLMKKKNAINDYIACAELLIKQGYTAKGLITAAGSSAGGIVIGAAVNERPELFKAALLMMPSVDPLTDLLDSVRYDNARNEWPEFGNPFIREQFEYLYSYAPYNNVKKQDYPAMLFRTSTKDQNADYSGPLKMVARLRATSTGKNIILIRTDDRKTHMGDTGISGDFEFWSENRAFLLDQYGIKE
jgi:oligopeptidase B